MDREYLSPTRREELLAELDGLKMVKRKEVAERLDFAKSLGDLSENAEYQSTREEQAEIEDRINQLENLLKNAGVITERHGSTADIGTTLVVKKKGDERELQLTIVGSEEANTAAGKISFQSPLGAALLGRKKGETVKVLTPRGPVDYLIIKVS